MIIEVTKYRIELPEGADPAKYLPLLQEYARAGATYAEAVAIDIARRKFQQAERRIVASADRLEAA